jgi:hypothetical protein
MSYVLPNRKAFADFITRTFLKYRKSPREPQDADDKEEDLCKKQSNARELLHYQKLIRDYMLIETPYRGILLYHGLGSGKTCSSIAVAESLLTTLKTVVMTPASLRANYIGELRKCGDPVYAYENHWRQQQLTEETRATAKTMGISDGFLDRNNRFFSTVPNENPNFADLPKTEQDVIRAQVEDILSQRYTFVNYNGLTRAAVKEMVPEDGPNPFEDKVVIVDEVHNFISRIADKDGVVGPVYQALYKAKRCKIVALSGTPVINRPNEIAYLMNLLRGPIERITIPFKKIEGWDEDKLTATFRQQPEVDTIEFNASKKVVMITRNPPQFRSVYNEKGDRIAVQYKADLKWVAVPADWINGFKTKVEVELAGAEIDMERVSVEDFEGLPSPFGEFSALFLDGLSVKNPLLFQRRIQGLVSYFKGADERMLPRRVDDDKMLEKVPMSKEQFTHYLGQRWAELKMDSNKGKKSLDENLGSYRVLSRLACNYLLPAELRAEFTAEEAENEDKVVDKPAILEKLKANPERYLSAKALEILSPKFLRALKLIQESMGEAEYRNQFVYSQYRELEGLGVFSAILEANGWQPYKIVKTNGQWVEGEMDPAKPAYTMYTGKESAEERELTRQIFNNKFESSFPGSLKTSVEARGKKILCLLMASSSGAEGITLANVRHVHILEPHWTPARHDQVIGRAIRICSHATLPVEERTVRISFYVSVFTEEQAKSNEFPNITPIRRADTTMKRYEGGGPVETFMSADEYLYEVAFEKNQINQKIGLLLKQSAVDCEIHRKLHSKEKPVISCMRFDSTITGEDLAFKPSVKSEDLDSTYLRNMERKTRRLQKVVIKGILFLIDPLTTEVFDGVAFEDNNRLIPVGRKISDTQIRWVLEGKPTYEAR